MEEEVLHIIPLNDEGEHEESSYCSCEPEVRLVNDVVLVIHNAYDGREAVEWANEILGNNDDDDIMINDSDK